jgi:hypothetical protein
MIHEIFGLDDVMRRYADHLAASGLVVEQTTASLVTHRQSATQRRLTALVVVVWRNITSDGGRMADPPNW